MWDIEIVESLVYLGVVGVCGKMVGEGSWKGTRIIFYTKALGFDCLGNGMFVCKIYLRILS